METIVEVYEDDAGNRPFDDWFDALPSAHAAKVVVVVARLEAGNRSNLKPVGKGVLEWRIDWGPGLRIYAGFDGVG
ncbi:hypothetical protein [Inquilinus sp. CAU 1745]|uniref:hypothetical protein n=1 Tax=Inquilinus sp. CAU 1745 TaxID=3140369 RepID=UPI00325B8F9E